MLGLIILLNSSDPSGFSTSIIKKYILEHAILFQNFTIWETWRSWFCDSWKYCVEYQNGHVQAVLQNVFW